MDITQIFGVGGGILGALALFFAGLKTNTANVWKGEAEAQKARGDRLFNELEEIKNRLTHIEGYNRVLVSIIATIDPDRIASLRNTQEGE